jgi:hypothetical protein
MATGALASSQVTDGRRHELPDIFTSLRASVSYNMGRLQPPQATDWGRA